MLRDRLRLGLLAEHQEVLVDGLVRRELASRNSQILPSKGGLLSQRTKRCEDVGLLQRSGHARVTLNREGGLGKLGMAQGDYHSMVSMLRRFNAEARWAQRKESGWKFLRPSRLCGSFGLEYWLRLRRAASLR